MGGWSCITRESFTFDTVPVSAAWQALENARLSSLDRILLCTGRTFETWKEISTRARGLPVLDIVYYHTLRWFDEEGIYQHHRPGLAPLREAGLCYTQVGMVEILSDLVRVIPAGDETYRNHGISLSNARLRGTANEDFFRLQACVAFSVVEFADIPGARPLPVQEAVRILREADKREVLYRQV